jgi:hypothetical protein
MSWVGLRAAYMTRVTDIAAPRPSSPNDRGIAASSKQPRGRRSRRSPTDDQRVDRRLHRSGRSSRRRGDGLRHTKVWSGDFTARARSHGEGRSSTVLTRTTFWMLRRDDIPGGRLGGLNVPGVDLVSNSDVALECRQAVAPSRWSVRQCRVAIVRSRRSRTPSGRRHHRRRLPARSCTAGF